MQERIYQESVGRYPYLSRLAGGHIVPMEYSVSIQEAGSLANKKFIIGKRNQENFEIFIKKCFNQDDIDKADLTINREELDAIISTLMSIRNS